MSETVLARARQPTIRAVAPASEGKGKAPDRARVAARFRQLLDKRRDYEIRWKAIRDYQLPFLGHFDDTADSSNPARRKDLSVNNGIAWEACQVFAGGVMSGLTPPSRQWFKFTFADKALADDTQAAAIMDARQEILLGVLAKSNFYNSVHSVYTELPFGQCPLAIFPHPETGVFFMPFPIGSYALDVGAGGVVNTFARRYELTAAQLKEQFGEENLPQRVREVLTGNNKYSAKFKVCWLVEPNDAADGEKLGREYLAYRSLYWLEGGSGEEWLHVGGFYEWPVPVARYMVAGLEPYAKGPGWFAEGDAKMLQRMEADYGTAVELAVKPPMQSTAATAMKGINLIPGSATVVDDLSHPVTPLFQVNVHLDHLVGKIERLENAIKRAYSADLFLMLDSIQNGQMTAREVMERTQEKLQQLGPVTERLQFEFLSPLIERVYGILDRAGVFPPWPEEMDVDGREIKIEYISPLAMAQKMSGLTAIEQSVAFVGQLVQLWPEAIDKINPTETVNRYMEMLGAPATIRRSDEEVQQMAQAKAEAAQQEKEAEMVMQAAPAINQATQAAKNLSEAAQSPNPAVQEWLGMPNLGG